MTNNEFLFRLAALCVVVPFVVFVSVQLGTFAYFLSKWRAQQLLEKRKDDAN